MNRRDALTSLGLAMGATGAGTLAMAAFVLPAVCAIAALALVAWGFATAPRLYRGGLLTLTAGVGVAMLAGVPSILPGGEPLRTCVGALGLQASTAALLLCVRRHPIVVQRYGFR